MSDSTQRANFPARRPLRRAGAMVPPRFRAGIIGAAIAALSAFALLFASSTSAAAPEPLLQMPEDTVLPGEGAGRLAIPRGLAANPDTGHVYVGEHENARVSEFTAWGDFVRAWGWDVAPEGAPGDTASDEFEICSVVCKKGVEGGGVGQMRIPQGIVIDGAGNVYVYGDSFSGEPNHRVQKFSASGQFLLMFGGDVNKTTGADVCTKADIEGGDECGAGVNGTADGQFSNKLFDSYITHNPITETIFVGDVDRIQEFNLDGTFKDKIDFEGELAAFDGESVRALAAAPDGDLYVVFSPGASMLTEDVFRLDPASGAVLDQLGVLEPIALAVGPEGNVYVVDQSWEEGVHDKPKVVGFDPFGQPIEGMQVEDDFATAEHPIIFGGERRYREINGIATNFCSGSEAPGNLYASYARQHKFAYLGAFGTPPLGCEPPAKRPPEVVSQYAVSVGTEDAVLKADINARFWADTTYYLQYGEAPCSAGGCTEQPPPPGALLSTKVATGALPTKGLALRGLKPGTTYHYRFVAQGSGSEGAEVRGVGGTPGEDGAEGRFRTFALPAPGDPDCPNAVFRVGPSAGLPDCRAYEMVSPLNKNDADIASGNTIPTSYPTELPKSSLSGERFTYSSAAAFAGPASAAYTSQYLAERDPRAGWMSEALTAPRTRLIAPGTTAVLDNDFRAFSDDLCTAWLRFFFDPPLAAGAVAGFPNLYRRDNCGGGGYEALTVMPPPHADPLGYVTLAFQGGSADGSRAIYSAPDNLTPDAPINTNGRLQLYKHTEGGGLSFVCVLPNGNPTAQPCYAGTPDDQHGHERVSSLHNAISADGERIFWTASNGTPDGPGKIYVRIGGEETRFVSQSVASDPAFFWGAAEDGSTAVFEFTSGPNANHLYRFDVDAKAAELIADDVVGVLGMSADASHLYFASTEALPGAGANGEGAEAVAGEPNLYLDVEGAGTSFVGTLAGDDINPENTRSPVHFRPFRRAARVTADGRYAAFVSLAPLTGYDSTDLNGGNPAAEIFLYAAAEDELRCVSCNPTGARPAGRMRDQGGFKMWLAAELPTSIRSLETSRALSDDGRRLFFESYEALVPGDANGVMDVYQWEEEGAGSCQEIDPTFNPETGGCVELISSGQSPRDSKFLDADPSGENVFFSTLSSLVAPDYGLVDVYDARVDGGFAYPTAQPSCEGETCQNPAASPLDPSPASLGFRGAGNVTEESSRCPRGKVRRRGRCTRPRCAKRRAKAGRRTKVRCANQRKSADGTQANNNRRGGR